MKTKSHAWVIEVTFEDGEIRYDITTGYIPFLSRAKLENTREKARNRLKHIRTYSYIKSARVRKVVLA